MYGRRLIAERHNYKAVTETSGADLTAWTRAQDPGAVCSAEADPQLPGWLGGIISLINLQRAELPQFHGNHPMEKMTRRPWCFIHNKDSPQNMQPKTKQLIYHPESRFYYQCGQNKLV
ncbi:hypothetical protein OYC64_008918 [Pagothenia borchgrevinki]|uniref:Uncharacterized protein n=1 Tax=Pagothenia borchgrevinki TaxID=8213 RepID=A0ABD2G6K4_PAGBO